MKFGNQSDSQTQVVGMIAGQPIRANQLTRSDSTWQNGYGTPSDGNDTNSQNKPTRKLTKDAKSIIIYFSRSGSTELLASKIAKQTDADILEIVVKNPYSGNYKKTLARANSERESANYPELDMNVPDLSQYKTVYLGYPIWAMTLSHPMTEFLTDYGSRLSNKKIAPFMTEGGYGQGDSVDRIKQILKSQGATNDTFTKALVVDGNKVNKADERVDHWVKDVK
ncbi:flavodoxin [Lactobacillus selangorensis]|uniref:Flavodoxin n=1 Tax=Lactobacillus selangorensis TaxID=81857 RepID=A0A0R2FU19_9LACO|nr:flavodoxin [Lactobacillus selangorensis]KRN28698.1 flavodoxin [Lactobacillus selangorensis]KRN32891.1 flavodoxin [Lactobacillus selangorensis]